MDGFESQSSQPEGNNFDNDFEKLDPFGAPAYGDDHLVSSSTVQRDTPEEDLYSASPTNASEAEPLVNLADEPQAPAPSAPVETASQPDSSSVAKDAPAADSGKSETKSACCSAGAWMKTVDPRDKGDSVFDPVLDLIYWRDVKKTGIVFGSMMVLLLSLALCSVLSVLAYLSLAGLTITICFRIYKNVLGAVQKSGEGHPFKQFLDVDCELPKEKVHELADVAMGHLSSAMKELRRLFLVEDFVDSLKFGLLLWVLTYIGAWFNGMTLIILGTVEIFTLPKVYDTYKVQIDQHVDVVRTKLQKVFSQIKEKIPLGKKKSE